MSRRSRRQKGDPTLSHAQLDQFARTLLCPTETLMDELEKELVRYGYKTTRGEKFCYAPGDIPVMLVAHVDTVHHKMPVGVLIDQTSTMLKASTSTGLGADDRCGVWGVRELLHRGLRPHVVYTDEEESGGHGAREAGDAVAPEGVRLLVEMDRMNDDDMVFYSCDSKAAEDYVGAFGFEKALGSFTDISILMPAWEVAGVNVSIGYYNQHTTAERCDLRIMLRNVNRVGRMLRHPPAEVIKYEACKYTYDYTGYSGYSYNFDRDSYYRRKAAPDNSYLTAHGWECVNGVWQKKEETPATKPPTNNIPNLQADYFNGKATVLDAEEARALKYKLGLTKKELQEMVDEGSVYVIGGLDAALPDDDGTKPDFCPDCQQYGKPDGGEDPCLECGRGLRR